MTTYFEAGLTVREFGTRLLNVPDLMEWAKSKRLHLRTTPPIDGFGFVHIETLLCAIERHATNLTHDQALLIVKNDPALQARMVAGMGIEQEEFDNYLTESPAWLVQADAHLQWRKTFDAAIKAGELVPLQFGSKLPIDTAPAQTAATPAPVVAGDRHDAVERTQVKRRTWRDVAWPYVVETFKASQYSTAKDYYRALENKAGANNSPFDKGTGLNLHSLYVREISETVTLKTIQNAWRQIKASR